MSKTIQIRVVAGIAICLLASSAEAQYNGGAGDPNDPYQIATAEDLILLGESPNDYDKHFILTADIDLDPNLPGRRIFDRAVIAPDTNDADDHDFQGTPFTGVFDGNGHTISRLTITGNSYLGLFGQTGSGANVSNLGLEAVNVNGIGDNVAGLVGSNGEIFGIRGGSITASYSTGAVSSGDTVGGLVGENYEGTITASYSTCSVSATRHAGGLVGTNWGGRITTCYSTGAVPANILGLGGLVGLSINSHIASCFWDMETSGQPRGLTTAEMQSARTFLDAGWDFIGETDNGTDDIWSILEGQDYPRLWWENAPGEPGVYPLYVDDDAPDDPGPGDPQVSDPRENGSHAHPFDSIQEAIDVASDYLTVQVQPGLYLIPENPDAIGIFGKNITLRSSDPTDWDTVNNTVIRGIIQFDGTEDPNCKLIGFRIHDPYYGAIYGNNTHATISHCVISGNGPCGATVIKDCDGTISNCLITDNTTFFYCGVFPVVSGCNGLIRNCTIANNISGVSVGTATIENCIIYHNAGHQLGVDVGETLSVSYSNIQGGLDAIVRDGDVVWGPGSINMDPYFVGLGTWWEDPPELTEGDYHLSSRGWHWNTEGKSWTWDETMTSPCVDAGDPDSPLGEELLSVPRDPNNEYGENLRINMGAYGGTAQASMGPLGWLGQENEYPISNKE